MAISKIEKAAYLSIGVNALLALTKYGLASLSGSIALVADAWHSLSDVAVSLLVLAGVWISKKGWRSAAVVENIIALAISGLIFSAAFVLIKKSLAVQPEENLQYIPVALFGAVICAAASKLIGQYKTRIGREQDSLSLRADGSHSIMDFYTTVVVIAGLLGQMIGLKLDNIAGAVVILFVAEVGFEIAFTAIKGLVRRQEFSQSSFQLLKNRFVVRLGVLIRHIGKRFGWPEDRPLQAVFADWLKTHRRRIIFIGSVIVFCIFCLSGIFSVKPHQAALVTVFGKALPKPAGPGMHYAPPRPIGRVYKIDASLIRRIEVGFRTRQPAEKTGQASRSSYEWQSYHKAGTYEKRAEEAIMLTGDENLLDLNAVIHYDISNPYPYAFGFSDIDALLRFTTEAVLRSIVSVTPIDSILAGSRQALESRAFQLLQAILDRLGSGVRIVAVELQDVHPPTAVVDAFRDVASAKEDMALIVNQAYSERNQNIPTARAKAFSSIAAAEAYRASKAARAAGEAERFASLIRGTAGDRQIAMFRMYVERMEKSLGGTRKFLVSPSMAPGTLDLRVFTKKPQKSGNKNTGNKP